MNKELKVAFCGGEGLNWALDHDLEHVRRITRDFVEEVPLAEADLVHSVWWRGIMHIPAGDLAGKVVIASIADDPKTMMSDPEYLLVRSRISAWMSEYTESLDFVVRTRQHGFRFPDPIELDVFKEPESRPEIRRWLHGKYGVPLDGYLIGNFHRDSSMTNLNIPKKQKGADFLLEIVTALMNEGENIHVLLVGPRRHYLRKHFQHRGIPYTFIGEEIDGDDVDQNTRPLEEVAKIMRGLDLYLITSRWEGAPNTLLEAASSLTCILSTPVGQAEDMLYPEQIFRSISEAVSLIRADISDPYLKKWTSAAQTQLRKWNTDEALGRRLRHIYHMAMTLPPVGSQGGARRWLPKRKTQGSLSDIFRKCRKQEGDLAFSIWTDADASSERHAYWQCLFDGMKEKGCSVQWNQNGADCAIVDSEGFYELLFRPSASRVVQYWLGNVDAMECGKRKQVLQWNQKHASCSVYASGWEAQEVIYKENVKAMPFLIRRGVDTRVFFPKEKKAPVSGGAKLISRIPSGFGIQIMPVIEELRASVSGQIESWTLVGKEPEVAAVQGGDKLEGLVMPDTQIWADVLREHHVYVELNPREGVGTAVGQALACGLPVIYRKGGVVPELSEYASLAFRDSGEFSKQLEQMIRHYSHYVDLIWIPDMKDNIEQLIQTAYACLTLKVK